MTDTSLDIKLENTGAVLPGRASVRDYIALLKPRVMSLVVFSGFAGLIAAPGTLHPLLAAVAVLCIAVSAGAAGAINMWYDRDIDAIMERTKSRPLPQGRVSADEALSFGVTLTLFSTMLMGLAVNWTAAILLISANAFYVFIYTMWLKRSTPHNIVIGGAAGAFPPMIGWAAVTGSVELQSIVLFLIIFMWTPPHFWALALFREIDYAKAGVPMLPVVAGTKATKWQMLLYTLVLVPITLLPSFLGTAGPVYGVVAFLLGLRFIHLAVKVLRDEGVRYTKPMFGFSILYLFALFALLMLDRSPGILVNLGLLGGVG